MIQMVFFSKQFLQSGLFVSDDLSIYLFLNQYFFNVSGTRHYAKCWGISREVVPALLCLWSGGSYRQVDRQQNIV